MNAAFNPKTKGSPSDAVQQGRRASFEVIEAWDEEVDGADLLNEIHATIRRYVAMTDSEALAMTLWSVHAHAHDCATASPGARRRHTTYALDA